jgi:hypothetical protein
MGSGEFLYIVFGHYQCNGLLYFFLEEEIPLNDLFWSEVVLVYKTASFYHNYSFVPGAHFGETNPSQVFSHIIQTMPPIYFCGL